MITSPRHNTVITNIEASDGITVVTYTGSNAPVFLPPNQNKTLREYLELLEHERITRELEELINEESPND